MSKSILVCLFVRFLLVTSQSQDPCRPLIESCEQCLRHPNSYLIKSEASNLCLEVGAPPQSQGYPGAPPKNQGYQGAPPNNQGYQGATPNNQGYQGATPNNQGYQGATPNNQGYQGAPPPSQGHPGSQPRVDPPIDEKFRYVDLDNSGRIDAAEFGQSLSNGYGTKLSVGTFIELVDLYDIERVGTLNVQQFDLLLKFIQEEIPFFSSSDRDRSGSIGPNELGQALQSMGYRVSPTFLQNTATKYGGGAAAQRINLDQFILIVVQVSRLTESFKKREGEMKGQATMQYEDFLGIAMGSHK